jgi:immune inhibitor A
MRDFYIEQSSGRFTWTGQVSNWVPSTAPRPISAPTRSRAAPAATTPTGRLSRGRRTLKAWPPRRNYGGLDLAAADQVDRYDCDGDGNFAEPDGYIDHFAIVHAGEGEEAAARRRERIWSHRWYANFNQTDGRPAATSAATTCPARTSGWATTPSSPRTAASASSPTSSATTSACPTCTTRPEVPTTGRASGPS